MADVKEQLARQGIRLQRQAAGGHKLPCPKCSAQRQKSADPCLSVTVEESSAVWKCHHCEWSGAVTQRDDQQHRRRHVAAVRPSYSATPQRSQAVNSWFASRGIIETVLDRNRIGTDAVWMPGCADGETVQAITFPYVRDGEVVNIKFRSGAKGFRQVKDAEKVYYGLDDIPVGTDTVIIVEGEIDKLSLEVAGFTNVVSVPDGAPQLVKAGQADEGDRKFSYIWNCKDYFERVMKIILAVDGDGPGQSLAEELARRYGKHRCWSVTWPDGEDVVCKDANDVLVTHGTKTLCEVIESARPYPIKSLHGVEEFADETLRLYRGDSTPSFSTGWSKLDKHYRVRPGELSVVTGTPNAGKSQWLDALMVNLADNHGWNFAICSFENSPPRHIANLAEIHGRAPFWEGPTLRMSEADLTTEISWIAERFFFIRADDEAPTVDWILETARAAVMRHGINGLIIDPYNEIEHKRPGNMTETEYVSELLGKVKRFAQGHGVHVWFVAHPAKPMRTSAGTIPKLTLYDISGAAHWANKADVGIVIDRNWDTGETSVQVKTVRNREVGQVGEVRLKFDKATGRYTTAA